MHAPTKSTIYEGAFADPVFGSQAVFRAVMDAMANPGRVVDLGRATQAPAPIEPAAIAVLATLADYDTAVWFEAGDRAEATQWLAFHTGAPITTNPTDAAFAVLSLGSMVDGWSQFPVGTASYPDRSATLLLPVDDFTSGAALTLKGPGIKTTITVAPAGLPQGFAPAMAANAALFPLGLDVILVCNSAVLALPRTTRITEA